MEVYHVDALIEGQFPVSYQMYMQYDVIFECVYDPIKGKRKGGLVYRFDNGEVLADVSQSHRTLAN